MHITKDAIIEKAHEIEEGVVEFIVSTDALDSHGERIKVEGINLDDFKKNPVVLWAHDGFNLPIAKTIDIWKEAGKLKARAKFYMKDEFPRKVYEYIKDGFLNAASIGGMVDEWGDDGMTINKLTMKEFSVVSIGANPEALAIAKGMDKGDAKELSGLARAYARKVLVEKNDDVFKDIEVLENLVAALKEVAVGEPQEVDEKANHIRIMLSNAQTVDHQAEKVIRKIKLKRG